MEDSHIARFIDGPRDGQSAVVPPLESGQPPELLLTPGKSEWVYVRAGAPWRDGSLPYLHMSPSRAILIPSRHRRSVGLADS